MNSKSHDDPATDWSLRGVLSRFFPRLEERFAQAMRTINDIKPVPITLGPPWGAEFQTKMDVAHGLLHRAKTMGDAAATARWQSVLDALDADARKAKLDEARRIEQLEAAIRKRPPPDKAVLAAAENEIRIVERLLAERLRSECGQGRFFGYGRKGSLQAASTPIDQGYWAGIKSTSIQTGTLRFDDGTDFFAVEIQTVLASRDAAAALAGKTLKHALDELVWANLDVLDQAHSTKRLRRELFTEVGRRARASRVPFVTSWWTIQESLLMQALPQGNAGVLAAGIDALGGAALWLTEIARHIALLAQEFGSGALTIEARMRGDDFPIEEISASAWNSQNMAGRPVRNVWRPEDPTGAYEIDLATGDIYRAGSLPPERVFEHVRFAGKRGVGAPKTSLRQEIAFELLAEARATPRRYFQSGADFTKAMVARSDEKLLAAGRDPLREYYPDGYDGVKFEQLKDFDLKSADEDRVAKEIENNEVEMRKPKMKLHWEALKSGKYADPAASAISSSKKGQSRREG